jgi:hypothetical protein
VRTHFFPPKQQRGQDGGDFAVGEFQMTSFRRCRNSDVPIRSCLM